MPLYQRIIAPILFRQDAEEVHHKVAGLMERAERNAPLRHLIRSVYGPSSCPELSQTIWGKKFDHPIGLAAGFDKDAKAYKTLSCMGFSFVEIGTVTPRAQEGNPKPRLFRLKEDKALINRMGFNNEGVGAAAQRLRSRGQHLVGGNIGKNKATTNEKAIEDYLAGFDQLFDHVDYFTVNVSSPNTPGLRELQGREPLTRLLDALQERNRAKTQSKPVLLKIAPDLEEDALHEIVEVIRDAQLEGVVATNTTIGRSGLSASSAHIEQIGAGGLSGDPVRRRSTEVVGFLRSQLGKEAVIIGVGGVRNGRDAIEKIVAGANLVQVYTGFVYEGPAMVKRMLREMDHGLKSGHWTWPHRRI